MDGMGFRLSRVFKLGGGYGKMGVLVPPASLFIAWMFP